MGLLMGLHMGCCKRGGCKWGAENGGGGAASGAADGAAHGAADGAADGAASGGLQAGLLMGLQEGGCHCTSATDLAMLSCLRKPDRMVVDMLLLVPLCCSRPCRYKLDLVESRCICCVTCSRCCRSCCYLQNYAVHYKSACHRQ